jgi:hypothetical protein
MKLHCGRLLSGAMRMETEEMLVQLIERAPCTGPFDHDDLLGAAEAGQLSGIAVSRTKGTSMYLAFRKGVPTGAIFMDQHGALYSDSAAVRAAGRNAFSFYEVDADMVEALSMGCRILEGSIIRRSIRPDLPEIGKKTDGLGVITIQVLKDSAIAPGIRVTIRSGGKVLAHDITDPNGKVQCRLMLGKFNCITQDRDGRIFSAPVEFTSAGQIVRVNI